MEEAKLIMQHLQAPLPKLPEDLARFQPLLERMMTKDRTQRISDATALVAEVEKAQQAELEAEHAEIVALNEETHAVRLPSKRRLSTYRPIWMTVGGVTLFALGFFSFWLYAQTLVSSNVVLTAPITSTVGKAPEPGAKPAPSASAKKSSAPPVKDVIRALEWLARSALRADRLTAPPADNAYYYYSRLLALAPNNEMAQQGFSQIAERYVVLAEQEFANRNFRQSRIYIALGRQVAPAHRGLAALESFIDKQQETLLDGLIALFRS